MDTHVINDEKNPEPLERFNLMIARNDSQWLDRLTREIHDRTGAKVSRSEIVRAAIGGLRELHRLEPLSGCMSRSIIAAVHLLAIRRAFQSSASSNAKERRK